jgi:hypothetical protein
MHSRLPADVVQRIATRLARGHVPATVIAKEEGLSPTVVRAIRDGRHGHQRPAEEKARRLHDRVPDPTPEEIAERCAEIRRKWKRPREHFTFPALSQL